MKDIICIGHITLDKIVTPHRRVYMPGGTAFYFSHAMSRLCHEGHYRLITALARSEMKAVDEIREKGIFVTAITCEHSVYFENVYGDNPDNRTQRVLAKAAPFEVDQMNDVKADFIHLGTLLSDDFSLNVVRYLASVGRVSVDAQGFLREVRWQKVYPVDWKEKKDVLPYVDILKVNECEMVALTGLKSPESAAKLLASWGVKEVVITLGGQGSLIYRDGEFYPIPAYAPVEVVDATGCGDTYMAGYLYKRSQGSSCLEAGKFAAAISTLKLEHSGPFNGAEEDIVSLVLKHSEPLSF